MASNPTVKVGFLGDASQLAREAKRASASLDSVGRSAHTTSTAIGTALGTAAGRGIGAIASSAAHAAGSIGRFAAESITAASALNETVSKNAVVFGQSANSVKAWANDSSKNILLTKQAAIEAAATFGNLFVALGIGQAPAASLSTQMVALAEDLKSFNDVPIDEALTALKSGLLGEAEPLRKFGVSLSDARVQAEAYALGLAKPVKNAAAITAAHNAVAAATANVAKVQKEHGVGTLAAAQAQDKLAHANDLLTKAIAGQKVPLTDAQKLQARTSIIMKDTATARGDLARTQDSYANSTAKLHKQVGDLSVELGAKLLPVALDATHKVSELIGEFEAGTGTGGKIREDLVHIGDAARGVGDAMKPVVSLAQWFVKHPNAFAAATEGMIAYRVATKSAALWSERLAAANVAGAATGIGNVAGALAGLSAVDIAGWGAAAYGVFDRLSAVAKGLAGDIGPLLHLSEFGLADKPKDPRSNQAMIDALSPKQRAQFYKDYPGVAGTGYKAHKPQTPDDYDAKAGRGRTAIAASIVSESAKSAAAVKKAADAADAGQKYAADMAAEAAKRKTAAAAALQAANDAMQQALDDRRSMSQGVRDSLISSNSVVRDGVSWTAKDLLSRFQVQARKVQQFSTAISAMVAKGFDPAIVQQVASAGVQGGFGTAMGLSHASASQVRQIDATQSAISKAAGYTGDRVASQMGPIVNVYVDGKQIAATVITKHDQALATAVNRYNANSGRNGARLGS